MKPSAMPLCRYAFLGCLGFEARAICVFREVYSSPCPPTKAIIFFNEESHSSAMKWKEEFQGIYSKTIFKNISYADPIKTVDIFIKTLDGLLKDKINHVLIDTTTFTREWLLMLIALLNHGKYTNINVKYAYSYAATLSAEWLSTRPLKLRTVLGYPGSVLPSKRNHLFLILGHEIERALSIIDEIEPAKLTVIVGAKDGSVNQEMYQRNRYFENFIKNNYGSISQTYDINVRDYAQSFEDLKKVIVNDNSANIIVAPLNTKISTLAAGFVALNDKSIQICYLPMEQYNQEDFSTPSNENVYFSASINN